MPRAPSNILLPLGFTGALYLSMLFLAFINSMSVQAPVAFERTVSYRESAAGMYSSLPFALAACTVEVPYIFLQVCPVPYPCQSRLENFSLTTVVLLTLESIIAIPMPVSLGAFFLQPKFCSLR